MGKSGVKKPKQLKMEFNRGYVDSVDVVLRTLHKRLENVEIIVDAIIHPKPTANSKLSEEILNNLKAEKSQPVTASTPRPPHYDGTACFCTYGCQLQTAPAPKVPTCNHYACVGCTVCKYDGLLSAPPGKYNITQERNLKTYEAVKYALRLMQGISYTVGETGFSINVRRYNDTREICVHSYDSREFFSEVKYTDLTNRPRSHRYSSLAMVCADVTAIAMYYATR